MIDWSSAYTDQFSTWISNRVLGDFWCVHNARRCIFEIVSIISLLSLSYTFIQEISRCVIVLRPRYVLMSRCIMS